MADVATKHRLPHQRWLLQHGIDPAHTSEVALGACKGTQHMWLVVEQPVRDRDGQMFIGGRLDGYSVNRTGEAGIAAETRWVPLVAPDGSPVTWAQVNEWNAAQGGAPRSIKTICFERRDLFANTCSVVRYLVDEDGRRYLDDDGERAVEQVTLSMLSFPGYPAEATDGR